MSPAFVVSAACSHLEPGSSQTSLPTVSQTRARPTQATMKKCKTNVTFEYNNN